MHDETTDEATERGLEIDDTLVDEYGEVLASEVRVRVLEWAALLVFFAGWAVGVYVGFDSDDNSLGDPTFRFASAMAIGSQATLAAALLALASFAGRAYAAWRRDRFAESTP